MSKCLPAEKWWGENTQLWGKIRTSWNNIYSKNKDLSIKTLKRDTEIFEALDNFKNNSPQKDIDKTINLFIKN